MSFLLSLPGKMNTALANLATLLANWPSTKAALLDQAISSRAPAATALDNTVWTNARAALLDQLATLLGYAQINNTCPIHNPPTVLSPAPARISFTGYPGPTAGLGIIDYATVGSGYHTVITETGRGVIDYLSMHFLSGAPAGGSTFGCRLTIDGVVVFNSTTLLSNTDTGFGCQLFGVWNSLGLYGEAIPFYSQFLFEVFGSAASATLRTQYSYYRTP